MKERTKIKTNKPICSKNNNEHVGAGFMPAHNKGITLVALIITIIILLILAVVAINAVKRDGIIAHAKNAKTAYTKAQEEEQNELNETSNWIKENIETKEIVTKTFKVTSVVGDVYGRTIHSRRGNDLGRMD